jgi:hypothetical protein
MPFLTIAAPRHGLWIINYFFCNCGPTARWKIFILFGNCIFSRSAVFACKVEQRGFSWST